MDKTDISSHEDFKKTVVRVKSDIKSDPSICRRIDGSKELLQIIGTYKYNQLDAFIFLLNSSLKEEYLYSLQKWLKNRLYRKVNELTTASIFVESLDKIKEIQGLAPCSDRKQMIIPEIVAMAIDDLLGKLKKNSTKGLLSSLPYIKDKSLYNGVSLAVWLIVEKNKDANAACSIASNKYKISKDEVSSLIKQITDSSNSEVTHKNHEQPVHKREW